MSQPKAFVLLNNTPYAQAGARVYELMHHDYRLARDDTNLTGVPHVSVTLKEDGDYPSFTVAEEELEPYEEVTDRQAAKQSAPERLRG